MTETDGGPKRCAECGAIAVPRGSEVCRPCEIERDVGPEARKRYLSSIGSAGGRASSRKRGKGLSPEELGPLETHEDAMRWARTIALAAASERISASRATALRGLLREWRAAREGHVEEVELEELRAKVEALEREGVI